jgi:hypothetical protein
MHSRSHSRAEDRQHHATKDARITATIRRENEEKEVVCATSVVSANQDAVHLRQIFRVRQGRLHWKGVIYSYKNNNNIDQYPIITLNNRLILEYIL